MRCVVFATKQDTQRLWPPARWPRYASSRHADDVPVCDVPPRRSRSHVMSGTSCSSLAGPCCFDNAGTQSDCSSQQARGTPPPSPSRLLIKHSPALGDRFYGPARARAKHTTTSILARVAHGHGR